MILNFEPIDDPKGKKPIILFIFHTGGFHKTGKRFEIAMDAHTLFPNSCAHIFWDAPIEKESIMINFTKVPML